MSRKTSDRLMCSKIVRFLVLGFACFPLAAQAVLFYSTGDPSHNTNAPAGALEGSGWQFQGQFRNTSNDKYLGTPISAHYFITARHISSPAVGEPFYFGGVTYTTIDKINLTSCDLTVWEIAGTFPRYAPIYSKTINSGDHLVVFGRGTQRGSAVYANGELKGWQWGPKDFVMRWGENVVKAITTVSGAYGSSEPVIQVDFDASGGTNECMLSDKDSGGALFIQDTADGVWKLAGINSYIFPSTFSYNSSFTPTFTAAVFDYSFSIVDAEKLYVGANSYAREGLYPVTYPASFYCSHVATHLSEIQSILGNEYDQDADGLPDWYETKYAGNATSMVATNDSDGDHFTNYEEWIADTNPTNGSSYFKLGVYSNATSLAFSSSSNREYRVEYRLDLADTNESWQVEPGLDWFPGTGSQTVTNVTTATSNRFYRVDVKLP